jgi:hypothetical protein
MVQVTDTTTGEIYQAQLTAERRQLRGDAYRACGRIACTTMICWAVNANNIDGATPRSRTSRAPIAATALRGADRSRDRRSVVRGGLDLGASDPMSRPAEVSPLHRLREGRRGSFTELVRTDQRLVKRIVNHGTAYQWKVRSEDVNGNEPATRTPCPSRR